MFNLKKKVKGLTLISLVVTIIIMLILAGVTISIVSDGGLIGKAREGTRQTKLASIREQIAMDILSGNLDSIIAGRDGISGEEIKEIVNKYGTLDEDGDTIHTEYGDLSLKDITEGTSENDKVDATEEKIKELQGQVDDLTKKLEESEREKEQLETEKNQLTEDLIKAQTDKETAEQEKKELQERVSELTKELEDANATIDNLTNQINELETAKKKLEEQLAESKAKEATGTAVAGDVLTGKTFSNSSGVGITGTMPNRGTLNWSGINTTYSLPSGYYSGGTIDSTKSYQLGRSDCYKIKNLTIDNSNKSEVLKRDYVYKVLTWSYNSNTANETRTFEKMAAYVGYLDLKSIYGDDYQTTPRPRSKDALVVVETTNYETGKYTYYNSYVINGNATNTKYDSSGNFVSESSGITQHPIYAKQVTSESNVYWINYEAAWLPKDCFPFYIPDSYYKLISDDVALQLHFTLIPNTLPF